jgi:acyl-CoA thioesterase-1
MTIMRLLDHVGSRPGAVVPWGVPGTHRRHPVTRLLAALAAAAAVVILGGCAGPTVAVPAPATGSVTRPPSTGAATRLVVIGDSLSTGYATPGDPWTRQARSLFRARGQHVQITNASENGAGYVAPGDNGNVFLDLVDRAVVAQAQIVVVFGSDNDVGQTGVAPAMADTLHRVRDLAPDATLLVVGPPSVPADPGVDLTTIRDDLATTTTQVGGHFLDPLTLGWFQGTASQFVSDDGEHPNTDGEQYLAQQIVDAVGHLIVR